MIGWYELLQDFQPLIATFVALGAAIIAYLSVQRAAGTQSRTARETTERQIAHALAKEDENELKRRTAFLIMVGSRLRALASSLQRRIGTLEIFCEFARWDEHNVFISDKPDAYW